jgi:hypothetical protein
MLRSTLYWWRYDWRAFCREGIWRWIAHKLPERVVYFTLMRAYAAVWADAKTITPTEIDFERNAKWWGRKTNLDPLVLTPTGTPGRFGGHGYRLHKRQE